MEQNISQEDPLRMKQEKENDRFMRTRVYLENDTLAVIEDEDLALRRLDLENCDILQLSTAPEFQIYYKSNINQDLSNSQNNSGIKIIAVSKLINKKNEDLNNVSEILREKLRNWNKELELRTNISSINNIRIGKGKGRECKKIPTLLNLLNLLCSDKITTSKQRKDIRDAINLYLMGEIHYHDIFNIFEEILGEEILHHLIINLANSENLNADLDFSWMMRSFDFKNDDSLHNNLFSYLNINDYLEDNTKLYPLSELDSSLIPIIGHSTINCGPFVMFFGGLKNIEFVENRKKASINDFNEIIVLNTSNFKFSKFRCSGTCPCPSIYHSSNIVITPEGPRIILFGGLIKKNDYEFDFSDKTSIFDMKTRQWIIQDKHINTPRILHSTLTYPEMSSKQLSKFVIVFGGLTKGINEISPSNDLWIYSLKDNSWIQVAVLPAPNSTQTELPSPRFGHSMVWVNRRTFYIFGGEGRTIDNQTNQGFLLNDIWSFTIDSSDFDIENLNVKGYWTKISTSGSTRPFSTLHSCVALSIPKNNSDNSDHKINVLSVGNEDLKNDRNQHNYQNSNTNILFFIGGINRPVINNYPLDIKSNEDWFLLNTCENNENDKINLSVLNLNSNEWRTIKNFKITSLSPTIKSILTPNKQISDLMQTCMIKGVSCFFECFSINKNTFIPCILLQGFSIKEFIVNKELFVLSILGNEPYGSTVINESDEKEKIKQKELTILNKIVPFLRPKLNHNFSISTSIFSSLASNQSWIFGALSHIFDNSCSIGVNSTKVEIEINDDNISISDDGIGLKYEDLNNLLRQFGINRNGCQNILSSFQNKYGVGFKLAFSRLSNACLIFTKTSNYFGIGLIAISLFNFDTLIESRYWAPICYWHSDTFEPLIPLGSSIFEHNEKQKLILKYGPIKDPKTLCDYFSKMECSTGTKFVFFYNKEQLKLHQSQYMEISDHGINLLDENNSLVNKEETGFIITKSASKSGICVSNENLPFWTRKRYSIDYCLSTYLSWLYLNRTQKIFCQGKLLLIDKNSESLSLYEFLRSNLDHSAELSRILKNNDNDGAYALIGKLSTSKKLKFFNNENNSTNDDNLMKNEVNGNSNEDLDILEAGVLLYYNGRLIRRLQSTFPSMDTNEESKFEVTAIINVPQWLTPASNKQEFVLEKTGVFEKFQNEVSEIIQEYLNLYNDENKLRSWEAEFNNLNDCDSRPSKILKYED